jgi:protein-S-isoprenylcysteine O-methyltransferase Ste14
MAGAADGSLAVAGGTAAAGASRWLRLRPPRLALGLTAAALAAHALLWGPDAPLGSAPFEGAALLAWGAAWVLWSWALFRRAATPIRPTAVPTAFVDGGPFGFGRNPMYLGLAAAMLGLGLIVGSPMMIAATAAFVGVVHRVHIPFEEAQLRRAFGGWYSDYAAEVPRWL